jgi:hypothetical protein
MRRGLARRTVETATNSLGAPPRGLPGPLAVLRREGAGRARARRERAGFQLRAPAQERRALTLRSVEIARESLGEPPHSYRGQSELGSARGPDPRGLNAAAVERLPPNVACS